MANRLLCVQLYRISFCIGFLVFGMFQTTSEADTEMKTVVEGDMTSLICDISSAGENTVIWVYYENDIRRYISLNEYVYQNHQGRVEVSIDRNTNRYDMILTRPEVEDSWTYECGYEYGSRSNYGVIMTIVITVLSKADSQSCIFHQLPILPTSRDRETEVTCLWSHSKNVTAHFQKENGEIIGADLQYSDRIISRKNSVDVSDINCVALTLDNETISTSCTANNAASDQGLVRVDPFLAETVDGSNVSFTCTGGTQDYQSSISWHVANESGVQLSQDRVIEDQNHITIINVRANDQATLIECRIPFAENLTVSSFAALLVVEPTTPPTLTILPQTLTIQPTYSHNVTTGLPIDGNTYDTHVGVYTCLVVLCTVFLVVIIILWNKYKKNTGHGKSNGNATGNTNLAFSGIRRPDNDTQDAGYTGLKLEDRVEQPYVATVHHVSNRDIIIGHSHSSQDENGYDESVNIYDEPEEVAPTQQTTEPAENNAQTLGETTYEVILHPGPSPPEQNSQGDSVEESPRNQSPNVRVHGARVNTRDPKPNRSSPKISEEPDDGYIEIIP